MIGFQSGCLVTGLIYMCIHIHRERDDPMWHFSSNQNAGGCWRLSSPTSSASSYLCRNEPTMCRRLSSPATLWGSMTRYLCPSIKPVSSLFILTHISFSFSTCRKCYRIYNWCSIVVIVTFYMSRRQGSKGHLQFSILQWCSPASFTGDSCQPKNFTFLCLELWVLSLFPSNL